MHFFTHPDFRRFRIIEKLLDYSVEKIISAGFNKFFSTVYSQASIKLLIKKGYKILEEVKYFNLRHANIEMFSDFEQIINQRQDGFKNESLFFVKKDLEMNFKII